MSSTVDPATLLDAPLRELMAEAARLRDAAHGARITFSPKVFIPLTMLCRDRCGYCTFAKPPAHLEAPYLALDEVLDIARRGAALGCHEALFTLGEAPEDRYPDAADWLAAHGYASTVDYLVAAARRCSRRPACSPTPTPARSSQAELERLRAVSPSQGMMIETLAARLGEPGRPARRRARQDPERRLATLEAAGTRRDPLHHRHPRRHRRDPRRAARRAASRSATSHARHGHVQEVIVQNFLPKPGTAMWRHDACDRRRVPLDHRRGRGSCSARRSTCRRRRTSPTPTISGALRRRRHRRLGRRVAGHARSREPRAAVARARRAPRRHRGRRARRSRRASPCTPSTCATRERWLAPRRAVRGALRVRLRRPRARRRLGRGRRRRRPRTAARRVPTAGGAGAPGRRGARRRARGRGGRRRRDRHAARRARSRVPRVAAVADQLRRDIVGDVVTFVRNRNINYTNICTFKCRFCAFSKGPLSLNLRGDPYLLELEEIQRRVVEAVECGATEVCLQGGIHPSFDGDYYLDGGTRGEGGRAGDPRARLHRARGHRRRAPPRHAAARLPRAREGSRARDAARHRGRDPRRRGAGDHLPRQGRTPRSGSRRTALAHSVGLRSNVTIMFGHVERPIHVARHLVRTRDLQKETGGFTEFVPLPFVHMATPIYLQQKSRRGPHDARGPARARGRPHRVPRAGSTTSRSRG